MLACGTARFTPAAPTNGLTAGPAGAASVLQNLAGQTTSGANYCDEASSASENCWDEVTGSEISDLVGGCQVHGIAHEAIENRIPTEYTSITPGDLFNSRYVCLDSDYTDTQRFAYSVKAGKYYLTPTIEQHNNNTLRISCGGGYSQSIRSYKWVSGSRRRGTRRRNREPNQYQYNKEVKEFSTTTCCPPQESFSSALRVASNKGDWKAFYAEALFWWASAPALLM